MAKIRSLAERSMGLADNLVIKKRDPNAPQQTAPGRLMEFQSAAVDMQVTIDELNDQLKIAKQGSQRVKISRLHKIPGRQRTLSPEAYAELRENLRNNPMIEPVTVELREDGDWNILSGHNRVDIYVELGRTDIDIFELAVAKDRADVTAFYANLLHAPLTDFEKYQGIKKHMRQANINQQEMSRESGLSKSIISTLMSFDRLPADCILAIEGNPSCIGSRAASTFAGFCDDGKGALVTIAITALATNSELTQEAALKMVTLKNSSGVEKSRPIISSRVFKSGKSKFAEVKGVEKTLKISFTTEEDRIAIESEIYELIELRSKSKKV